LRRQVTDLSVAWMLFPARVRGIFRHAYGKADDRALARACGWALLLALVFQASSARQPADRRDRAANLPRGTGISPAIWPRLGIKHVRRARPGYLQANPGEPRLQRIH
jgi:hypothetical protein